MIEDIKTKNILMYIYSFFIPCFIMLSLFFARGIYPFSNESFMRTDMYHQYVPFMSELCYKFKNMESLFYTNHIGMGTNFLTIYAYYLSSPLNIFLFFIPQKYVIEFASYLVILKISLCSLAFNFYLSKHSKKASIYFSFFSIAYALSGYVVAYSWNIMWMDSLVIFPLLCLSFERLIKRGLGIRYSLLLGLTIILNYYIAIIICIFFIFYYFILLSEIKKLNIKKIIRHSLDFSIYSILGAMLSAILLLPQIYALKTTASSSLDFPDKFEMYFPIMDILVRHLPMLKTHQGLEHFPNIYAGTFIFLLIPLYYLNKNIKLKEKIAYSLMLIILLHSFSINIFNYIWHGFHFPNSLPARNSFIYIFIILFMSFRVFQNISCIAKKDIGLSFFLGLSFIIICQKIVGNEQEIEFYVYYSGILFLSLYTLLLYLYKKNFNANLLFIFAISVFCTEMTMNMAITGIGTSSRKQYLEDVNDIKIALEKVDNPLYRYKRVDSKTKNDGAFINYNSSSIFSSTAYAAMTDFFKKMGNEASTNAYSDNGNTPLFDSLFSIKYGIYNTEQINPYLKDIAEIGNIHIYEYPYILPLAFIDKINIDENWNRNLLSPIDVQNDLSNLFVGDDILKEIDIKNNLKNIDIKINSSANYYIYSLNPSTKELNVDIKNTEKKQFENLSRKYLLDLGYLEKGTKLHISSENTMNLKIVYFDYSILSKIYTKLSKNIATIKRYEAGNIDLYVNAKERSNLFLSIPYDKGWKAYVDGKRVSYMKYLDAFMSIPLNKGEHEIALKYEIIGFRQGIYISISAIIILIILKVISFYRKKNIYEYIIGRKNI